MRTFIMTLVFSIFSICGIGQVVPGQLRRIEVQDKIVNLTADFDSVIFVDIAGFFDEDLRIEGFGFKKNEIYKLKILFKESADFELSDFRKERISKQKRISAIRALNYSIIGTLNNDSLSIKSRTEIHMRVSDNHEWTALLIVGRKFVIKQSYAPEFYQEAVPTKEREIFMDIIKRVISLIND